MISSTSRSFIAQVDLDDINAFKNYQSYHILINDPNYKIIAREMGLRNGFAIFEKIS